jgi:hypothetical protein
MRCLLKILIASALVIGGCATPSTNHAVVHPSPAQYRYFGPHLIPASQGGGWCWLDGEHTHPYGPEDPSVYSVADDVYTYAGPTVVSYWDVHPDPWGGWCELHGYHTHDYYPNYAEGFSWSSQIGGYVYGPVGAPVVYLGAVPVAVPVPVGISSAAPVASPPATTVGSVGAPPPATGPHSSGPQGSSGSAPHSVSVVPASGSRSIRGASPSEADTEPVWTPHANTSANEGTFSTYQSTRFTPRYDPPEPESSPTSERSGLAPRPGDEAPPQEIRGARQAPSGEASAAVQAPPHHGFNEGRPARNEGGSGESKGGSSSKRP